MAAKRRRLSNESDFSGASDSAVSPHLSDDEHLSGADESNTEDELAEAKNPSKSKKTQKRKRRATSPSNFGTVLQSLLSTDAPSNLPLSLKPSVARRRHDDKLEVKAKKVLEGEKKEREELNHVKDVIGGWGGESERALRKVAQRGVVQLFNVIQQAQAASAKTVEKSKASRGTGKPSLPAPQIDSKRKHVGNSAVRGAATAALAQDDFLDLIRSGGIPPKIPIRKEEWDRRLHEVPVTKHDLNRLIMDYLVIEGYKTAAEEFSKEADLSSPIDFESIEDRMNIREAVQRGDVEEAIMRVNDLNPEQQKLIEYIRQGRVNEALQFAQRELAPRGEESPEFLSELERTMALLAFDSSPSIPPAIAELLSPAQRLKTAGELNAAILESSSQGKDAKLIGLVKLLCWGESMLDERAEFPKVDLRDGLIPGVGEKEIFG
ncbi:hypothetical protein BD410DRAFT_798765 [Rickenella mellea]|uniref:CTLH domain-containing protein n=1 Tax=Rickenella mellea TaxID=50990 RepID=A0A4Y7QLK8_9AGAM|nr:hypothetical protein BD410DRAFT_798765 [Rickenella mellea]